MDIKNPRHLSYLLSFAVHLLLIFLFLFIRFNIEEPKDEFVTVGFGTYGKVSTSGSKGKNKPKEKPAPKEIVQKKDPQPEELKTVELPKAKNPQEIPVKSETEKAEDAVAITENQKVETTNKKPDEEAKGEEETDKGNGNFGFEIDFGGKGIRKIYSYSLPKYPPGVSKEIDVKLRFTILPDGTVGKVFPLIKADPTLESVSIQSLKQWRFEPLSSNQKQIEQSAVIVFPYRLR
ncbi:MAG: hypothetical protein GXO87_01840 [Chlorobi bacterium]|nr:hypothetical protein [Chlorobiota bacterium]